MPVAVARAAMVSEPDPVEVELAAWKAARRRAIPWRQVHLMATLCFGIASFVLSAAVSTVLDGLLGALAVMSFIAWWRGRKPPQG